MHTKDHSGVAMDEALLEALGTSSDGATDVQPGHLAGVDDEGRLLFRPDGTDEVYPVAIGVALSDEELVHSAHSERRALVLLSGGSPRWRVLVGMLRERVGADARESAQLSGGLRVKVDGEAVRITARSEIELRCGKARLLMHKDGRIEISGTHLLTRSRGPVKIKGATIALN